MNLSDLDGEAAEIVRCYEYPKAAMLPLLWLVQENQGYISPEAEAWVGRRKSDPARRAYRRRDGLRAVHGLALAGGRFQLPPGLKSSMCRPSLAKISSQNSVPHGGNSSSLIATRFPSPTLDRRGVRP